MLELENFKNELMMMIKNIQFINVNNNFQGQLNGDIKQIKEDTKISVPADKSLASSLVVIELHSETKGSRFETLSQLYAEVSSLQ